MEKCFVLDQNNLKIEIVVLFDSAGGLNFISPGHPALDHFDSPQYSQALTLETVNGPVSRRYPIHKIHLILKGDEKGTNAQDSTPFGDTPYLALNAHESPFPLADPSPVLLQSNLRSRGEKFADIPTQWELDHLPSLCCGLENLAIHPVEVEEHFVPKYIRKKFPHAVVLRSKVSKKLILAGNINNPATDRTISNLMTINNFSTPSRDLAGATGERHPSGDSGFGTNDSDPGSLEGSDALMDTDHSDTISLLAVSNHRIDPQLKPHGLVELPDLLETSDPATKEGRATLPVPSRGKGKASPHDDTCKSNPCMYQHFSTESQTMKASIFLYQLYLNDLKNLFSTEASKSLDVLHPGRVGCSACDSRHSVLTNTPLANNNLLSSQLKWVPLPGTPHGIFMVNRLYRASITNFPSCENATRADTLALIYKLRKRPNTGAEVSYRLQKDFLNKNCVFLTPGEKKQLKKGFFSVDDKQIRPIFLPQHCVFNLLSVSSPCRVVNVPNRLIHQLDGSLRTYNDQLRDYALSLNDIERLQLAQCTALETAALDVSDAFKSCSNSETTAWRCLTLCLQDKNGLPTYLSTGEERVGDLQVLKWQRCSYGISDLPRIFSTALGRCVEEFRRHSNDSLAEDLLTEVLTCLLNYSYCDDLQINASHQRIVIFAGARGLHPPVPSDKELTTRSSNAHFISKEYCKKYDMYLTEASDLYLLEVTKGVIKVLGFSNFFVKTVDTRSPKLRGILNSSSVLLKPPTPRLPTMPRPNASSVHGESGKMSKGSFVVIDLPQPVAHSSPIYLTQLSRNFHLDGKLTLKTRHLSMEGSKNPKHFVYSLNHYIDYVRQNKLKIDKRHLFSLAGQYYDLSGICLCGAKAAIKVACHALHNGPEGTHLGWDDLVGEKVEKIILIAVEWYFLAVNKALMRTSVYNYQAAGRLLVIETDAGAANHGIMAFLVSFVYLNGHYSGRTQLLLAKPFVNHSSIKSVPYFELLSLSKATVLAVQYLTWLDSIGLTVQPCNTLLLCDSQTALIQGRGRAALFSHRVSHLVAKIALKLLQSKMCPFRNLYFFRQESGLFHIDNLTKLPKDSVERAEERLRDHKWLNSNPSTWSFITRGPLPASQSQKDLAEDIELNADYLQEAEAIIKEFQQASDELFEIDRPIASRGEALSATTIHLLAAVERNPPFSQLIMRKMAYGIGTPRGSVRILSRAYFYVKRLQHICSLPLPERVKSKGRMLQFLVKVREKHSAWCGSLYCNPGFGGRSTKNSCLHPHHHRMIEDMSCLFLQIVDSPATVTHLPGVDGQEGPNKELVVPEHLTGENIVSPPLGDSPDTIAWESPLSESVVEGVEESQEEDGDDHEAIPRTRSGLLNPSLDYPTPLTIKRGLDIQVRELARSPWTPQCEKPIEAIILQVLCCYYRENQPYSEGVKVYTTQMAPGFFSNWCLSRMQRDRGHDPTRPMNTGRAVIRLISPKSPLGQLVLVSAHAYSDIHETHGANNIKSISFLLQLGIYFRTPKKYLDTMRRRCQQCTLNRSAVGKSQHKIIRSRAGPSESLSTLSSSRCNVSSAIIDLCGPWKITCLSKKCKVKCWVLVLITDLGRCHLSVLRDYSTAATLESLLTFSNTWGSMQWYASDDGSNFSKFHSALSPLPDGSETLPGLDKIWADLLQGAPQRRLREEAGSTFRKYCKNRHACVGIAEKLVHSIKVFLVQCKLFKRCCSKKPTLDLLSFQYYLSKIQNLANTRPIYLHKNLILSIQDIPICAQLVAPHTGSSGLTRGKGAAEHDAEIFSKRLDEIQNQTNLLMIDLFHHLCPKLLETEEEHPKNKDGPLNTFLAVGDIVLDRLNVIKTGNLTCSLAKVLVLSEDNRWCLVSRVKPSVLSDEARRVCLAIKRGRPLTSQQRRKSFITVGRQVTDLFLVAKGTNLTGNSYATFNKGSALFDFSLCLARIGRKQYTPMCLPPSNSPPVDIDINQFVQCPEQWSKLQAEEGGSPPEALLPSEESDYADEDSDDQELSDEDKDVETGEDPPTRTRSGRVSKRPNRLGL